MTTNTLTEIRSGTYTIDPARSTCRFTAKHAFGLKPAHGTMTVTGGTVTVATDPARSIASAELDATSFTTDDPRRDRDVRGPRFLDTARHPEIGFRSTHCRLGPDGWQVAGVLSVRGGSCEVVLDLESWERAGDGYRFTAGCVVDRVAAGVRGGRGLIQRSVRIALDVVVRPA
ncbi:hypothetical protein GCM10010168_74870 [Actinoplanes ianthinogenes]|uniref:Lipid/polyisoprenoid-binding YceI-like domain-containing protein n=1 Tax=Actinoplanes ianthinogenes TaxID=122358 RepID=A0ABM7LR96_9ACTN|nr:YceI family protein [Actinoplanes ianthinogenes]BCJ41799.1 hypothetical protein Aiant_24560 [Actinoplanes ianthinogenes]GGR45037.1 hypothetical protein GCM10010168_74870 [Actinoplanes ianthinogenes]